MEQKVVVFIGESLGVLFEVLRITISYGGPRVDDEGINGFEGGDILGCLVGGGPWVVRVLSPGFWCFRRGFKIFRVLSPCFCGFLGALARFF